MNAAANIQTPTPRTAHFRHLIEGLAATGNGRDAVVTDISSDSRSVRPGALFLAVPGAEHDGRRHIADAIAAGAVAIVWEGRETPPTPSNGAPPSDKPAPPSPELALAAIDDLSRHIGRIADRFYGNPSCQLQVAVVTGTNGKTTCAHLGAQALSALGRPCGLIGTLGAGMIGHLHDCALTTPEPVRLHRELAAMLDAAAANPAAAVMIEGSSHGIAQYRLDGLRIHTALFTNLGRDHLDYHGDAANYGRAKARLFQFPGLECAVINIKDPFGAQLAQQCTAPLILTYGTAEAALHASAVQTKIDGIALQMATPWGEMTFESPLLGRANVFNLQALVAMLGAMGCEPRALERVIPQLRPAPGRMECVGGGAHQPLVVVDYAHTPDALHNALSSLREHVAGTLWCVFGCGGERDRGKRPLMGAIAERHADRVILTDDNPRREDSDQIIADIIGGMHKRPTVEPSRRDAVAQALSAAGAGDAVLIAGKGDETTQQIGERLLPFSDREVAADCLGLHIDTTPEQWQ